MTLSQTTRIEILSAMKESYYTSDSVDSLIEDSGLSQNQLMSTDRNHSLSLSESPNKQ